jgi:hypothetical protein
MNTLNDCFVKCADFINICNESTEFHFDDIITQLNDAKRDFNGKMQTGDIFITRHSNLAFVHIVFHLAVEKKNSNILVLFLFLKQHILTNRHHTKHTH